MRVYPFLNKDIAQKLSKFEKQYPKPINSAEWLQILLLATPFILLGGILLAAIKIPLAGCGIGLIPIIWSLSWLMVRPAGELLQSAEYKDWGRKYDALKWKLETEAKLLKKKYSSK